MPGGTERPPFGLLLYTPKNAKVRKDMINAGKRTAERVLALWSGVINSGHSDVRSLNPKWSSKVKTTNMPYSMPSNGPAQSKFWREVRADWRHLQRVALEGKEFLDRIGAATRTGNFLAAFRKLKLDPGTGFSVCSNFTITVQFSWCEAQTT